VELQSRVKELQARGLGLAAISYDPPDVLDAFSRQHGITFPLLSDRGSATIRRYGLLNPVAAMAVGPAASDPVVKANVQTYVSAVNPSARMVGMAFPGTFILDRHGRVTSRFFDDFYAERSTVASLMLKIGAGMAPVKATKLSTAQLEATAYPSDAALAPGNRITLALDVIPRPGLHVYAPGARGYRVVTLTIAPQPFVRVSETTYPTSEIYVFAPLNERVPVYQKPFTLRRDVVLEATPQARATLQGRDTVTLTGTFEYQACDDKVCFNPVSLPLTWTLSLRALVTTRPTEAPR
jgi:peroxiredoxin